MTGLPQAQHGCHLPEPFPGLWFRALVGLSAVGGCWPFSEEKGWFLRILYLQVTPSFRARWALLPSGYRGRWGHLSWAWKALPGHCSLTQDSDPGPGSAPSQGPGPPWDLSQGSCVCSQVSHHPWTGQLPVPVGYGVNTCSFSEPLSCWWPKPTGISPSYHPRRNKRKQKLSGVALGGGVAVPAIPFLRSPFLSLLRTLACDSGPVRHCQKSDIGDLWPLEIFPTRVYAVGMKFLSFWTKVLQFWVLHCGTRGLSGSLVCNQRCLGNLFPWTW